ncbi:MAG: MFS transporter, partial [Nitrososphaerota archaeon]|nr:MFS transporter [Nitrososphaerota archaeon]
MQSSEPARRAVAQEVIARQDRIPIWALSYIFIGILGAGYVFIFYDIFNINVSFIQTALTLGWVKSPTSLRIAELEGPAVLLNVVGYVIGALILSPLSDRYGRREMLIFTLLITGAGSILNAFVSTYTWFVIARTITGIGVGADLALVNTYINEVAPTNGRAKYTALLFVLAGIGTVSAVWLGLILTTPSAPYPYGLPFALGGSGFMAANGW